MTDLSGVRGLKYNWLDIQRKRKLPWQFESFGAPLPLAVRLCDNREGFVTLSCRNLEAFLFSSLSS
jgi:hypothetical protein